MQGIQLDRLLGACALVLLLAGCRTAVVVEDEHSELDRRPRAVDAKRMLGALDPIMTDDEKREPIPAERLVVESMETEDVVLDGEGRYSVKVRDADIRDVLLAIGRESPYNIVVSPEAEAKVTVDLENTSLEKLLKAILKDTDLTYQLEDDIVWVLPLNMRTEIFGVFRNSCGWKLCLEVPSQVVQAGLLAALSRGFLPHGVL